ncbi:MAG: DUF1343 domain-containing protein [Chlorobiaceae bacterium]|nr:DUF1343 domain-containing protein [Chlorobiaceae bacterium]
MKGIVRSLLSRSSGKACISLLFFFFVLMSVMNAFGAQHEPLLCGIDRLELSGFKELSGLKVGLITNRAGIDRNGEADYAVMLRNGIKLQYLMAPEHGFSAEIEAGRHVSNADVGGSLPVYSLYGATKKPDSKLLASIDILVFDLQDIGTRCYTYISTMKYAMEACEESGTPFMVLDRPNPVSPLSAEGFMPAPGYTSFVGAVDIPFVHSMTVGEIALLLKKQLYKRLDLRVIKMHGYHRDRFADEYPGFRFVSPSPNIRNVDTAILYPATVFLEGTSVSEGRGTDTPFMQFGAPFVNSRELAAELKSYRLPGVAVDTVSFRPSTGKFKGQMCNGLKMTVKERKTFSPFRTSAAILLSLQALYPGLTGLEKNADFFDKLAGTPRYREMIIRQETVDRIVKESSMQVEDFRRKSCPDLLYR